jgi:hypothetical protein
MHPFSRRIPFIQYLSGRLCGLREKMPFPKPPPTVHENVAEKIIFLHIPKTAGTSVRQIVRKEYPGRQCLFIYSHTPEFFASIQAQLPAARAVYGHVSFGIHEVLGIRGRYVTFLRDPVRRVVSFYNHQRRKRGSEFYHQIKKGLTLREMLQSGICHQVNNHMVRIVAGYEGIEPIDDTAVFQRAVSNMDRSFELVGLVERLPESVALLGRRLGFQRQHRIPRRNVNFRPRSQNLDEGTLADIRAANRLDLMLYEHVYQCFENELKTVY